MPEAPLLSLGLAFVVSAVAGWVDAIAGGGGMLTVPFLLNLGLPPSLALGTNKFQSSFGSLAASWRFSRAGELRRKTALHGAVFTLCGALAGAWLVQRLKPAFLGYLMPFMLAAILLYIALAPDFGGKERRPRFPEKTLFCGLGLLLGFYDGFFGPGTGTLWAAGLVAWGGLGLLKATGYTKVMNFTSNIAALAFFMIGGNVSYAIGCVMAIGQFLGGRLGASMAVRKGTEFVRPVFLGASAVLTAVLFYRLF